MRQSRVSWIDAGRERFRNLVPVVVAAILGCAMWGAASAQPAPGGSGPIRTQHERDKVNGNLVGLVTGSPGGKYMPLGTNLARVLDDRWGGEMRLMVSFGYGSVQNIDDLLNLRGIDLAIVQGDVLDSFRSDKALRAELRRRMRYVTRLHNEDIHVLARGDLRSVRALDGKRVAIDVPGSGTQITARNLFDNLGIHPVLVEIGPSAALDDLIAGRIDAMIYVVGKGAQLFRSISGETAMQAALTFVPFASDEGAFAPYEAATLEARDYPALIPAGERVAVRTVPAVLAVFAWTPGQPRYAPVARFVERFFDRAGDLGRRPGMERELWCQVDLAASVSGWERFSVASEWLKRNPSRSTRICDGNIDRDRTCFDRFFAAMSRAGVSVTDTSSPVAQSLYRDWQADSGNNCPPHLVR